MENLYETGVRPLIDEYLQKKSEEVRDYGIYWSASSAGQCKRLIVFKRLGLPKVPEIVEDSARSTRVFEAGHIFHEWVQRITKNAGISISSEQELLEPKYFIKGHYDDLLDINGRKVLYDYKTANSKAFNYDFGLSDLHRMQLGTYMLMLRKEHPDLTEARILQIEKDTLRMREHDLNYDANLRDDVVGFWKALNEKWNEYLEFGTLPDCTCHLIDNGWMAKRTKAGKVYNDFYFNGEPCSMEWYLINKENLNVKQ